LVASYFPAFWRNVFYAPGQPFWKAVDRKPKPVFQSQAQLRQVENPARQAGEGRTPKIFLQVAEHLFCPGVIGPKLIAQRTDGHA
jgi:hypothetical protein